MLCGADGAADGGAPASVIDETDEDPASGRRVDPRALAAVCALDDFPALFEESLTWDPASPRPVRCRRR